MEKVVVKSIFVNICQINRFMDTIWIKCKKRKEKEIFKMIKFLIFLSNSYKSEAIPDKS